MNYTRQILTIVNHGLGEKYAEVARDSGARGGTVLVGRGSASALLLRLLSLSDVERDVLITLVGNDEYARVWDAIASAPLCGKSSGISYAIPLGGTKMETRIDHELITVIVNRGYADDVMAAARKAGARGGTIIHARGTGKPDDERFFGVTIVPEKEQVLILSETATSQAIRDAISSLPCLVAPGSGIMYTLPVERFTQIGKGAE